MSRWDRRGGRPSPASIERQGDEHGNDKDGHPGTVVLLATTLLAGGYFVYYLYQWQWVRAQIAGIAFVATLLVCATRLVLSRLSRFERNVTRRLDALALQRGVSHDDQDVGHDDSEPDFPWLAPELSPRRYRGLAPLALLGTMAPAIESPDGAVFIPVLLGAGLVVGAIWYSAHYPPAPFQDGVTELTVQVNTRSDSIRPAAQTVEVMGRYCAHNAIAGVAGRDVRPAMSGSAVLVVSPVLDDDAQRRYGGCLEDANLEGHRLTVVDTAVRPEAQRRRWGRRRHQVRR